jgi:hypothetical protein
MVIKQTKMILTVHFKIDYNHNKPCKWKFSFLNVFFFLLVVLTKLSFTAVKILIKIFTKFSLCGPLENGWELNLSCPLSLPDCQRLMHLKTSVYSELGAKLPC